ncbi:MAG TPA: HesA/MoeB/ThiF family protein [Bacteroidales bacterium]|nr:HesA/MoeB/ThiF family protein [Bacteroidales bacterium]
MNETLSNREMRRYSKQMMIPEIGLEGQLKLKNANILVIGAGGLGSPVLQYLSSSGVGRISIIDFDIVDETNLARQTLYGSNDLGKLKSIIAKSKLEYLNPLCEYTIINRRIDDSGNLGFFRNYDLIVDATDNPETRYAISDACVYYKKPMVHGSVYKFEAIVSVFNYKNGPSYRDFNPSALSKSFRNPSPANIGLFGVLPGIAGIYMANEVIKILTGTGEVLSGKLLFINVFNNTFNIFELKTETAQEVNEPVETLIPA